MRTTTDYTDLVTSWLSTKPLAMGGGASKHVQTVALNSAPFAETQRLLLSMIGAFDLDRAVGAQLDIIGLWIGIGRSVNVPITDVYFSFNIAGLGFNEGIWKGPYDPDTGVSILQDEAYRTVLYAKIAANMWDGTMGGMVSILDLFYQRTGIQLTVMDNQDMSITVGWDNTSAPIPPIIAALVTYGYLPPRPMGVEMIYDLAP